MNRWEYTYDYDPITKREKIEFGGLVRASAPARWPQDWKVLNTPPKDVLERMLRDGNGGRPVDPWYMPVASAAVVTVGLIALGQRNLYGDDVGPFDITSAVRDVVEAETSRDILLVGADLQIGWERLEARIERARID